MSLQAYRAAVQRYIQEFRGQELDGPSLITRLSQLDKTLSFPTARELNQAWSALRAEAALLPGDHRINLALARKERKRRERKPRPRNASSPGRGQAGGREQEAGGGNNHNRHQQYEGVEGGGSGSEPNPGLVETCVSILFNSQDWLSHDVDTILAAVATEAPAACSGGVCSPLDEMKAELAKLQSEREEVAKCLGQAREQYIAADNWLQRMLDGVQPHDSATEAKITEFKQEKEAEGRQAEERLAILDVKLKEKQAEMVATGEPGRLAVIQQEILPALQLLCEKIPLVRPPAMSRSQLET